MKITIITVGKPHLSFAKEGIDEYIKRIGAFAQVSLFPIKENKDTESKITKLVAGSVCILLDETGKLFSTQELADAFESYKNKGENISLVIGGPDGHSDSIRSLSDASWALSPLTFPHDIATMLTTEAVYRALSLSAGHPYHRA